MTNTLITPQIASIPERLRRRNPSLPSSSFGVVTQALTDVERATSKEQSNILRTGGDSGSIFRFGVLNTLVRFLNDIAENDVQRERARQKAQFDTHKLALRA